MGQGLTDLQFGMFSAFALFALTTVFLLWFWLKPDEVRDGRKVIEYIPPPISRGNVIYLDAARIIQELKRVEKQQSNK